MARASRSGDASAFETLLHAHLRLVIAQARHFAKYGLAAEDLVSEGLVGLVEAARRFEPDRGVRLSTYAIWWIREHMRQYTMLNRRIIRAPASRHGRLLISNLRATQHRLTQETGTAPDAETVARELGVSVDEVEEVESALSGKDIPCNGDQDDGAALTVRSSQRTPEEIVSDAESGAYWQATLRDAIHELDVREQRVVERRYFSANLPSLESVGSELGLSRERVRQIELRACAKIRQAVQPQSTDDNG